MLAAAVLLWALADGSRAQATPWIQGNLSAKVIDSGYAQDLKTGAWEAEVVLRFRDLSTERRYNQAVQVQFLDERGKVLGSWKTFLSLSPGQAQHRTVRAPSHLGCKGELSLCPPLKLRLALKKPLDSVWPIPAKAVAPGGLPPAGVPLYVAKVIDGDTLLLLDGQKVRLLGIDAPEKAHKGAGVPEAFAREATELLASRVMDDPVTLTYDGERRDIYGRALAMVNAADGGNVNLELLQKGMAKVYARSDFSRKAEFLEAESKAKEANVGLWGKAKP